MKAMAHDVANRYLSAGEMLADMDEFRKNPAMLFDYNLPPIDAVTRLQNVPVAPAAGTRATAERVADRNTGAKPANPERRPVSSEQRPVRRTSGAAAAASARRKPQSAHRKEPQKEENWGKAATIAIIACSAVAILAIVIFLVMLWGNGMGQNDDQISMPTLVGKYYENLQASEDYVIDYPEYRFDETYEKGQIISQQPEPGDRVKKGVEVYLVVSLGPEPKVKTMENLLNTQQAEAENYLRGQGFVPLPKTEYSDTIPAGLVTRTEPEFGDTLEDGQTVILWISMGPEIRKIAMPELTKQTLEKAKETLDKQELNLTYITSEEASATIEEGRIIRTEPAVGKELKTGDTVVLYVSSGPVKAKMPNVVGEDLKIALKLLEYAGFTNVKYTDYVDSDLPPNSVVFQSVEKDSEVPVTTQIVLKLSNGPTEPPTTEPTTVPTTAPTVPETTKTMSFGPLEGATEPYTFELRTGGQTVYSVTIDPAVNGESPITVTLTGSGVVVYDVYFNGIFVEGGSIEVNFSA